VQGEAQAHLRELTGLKEQHARSDAELQRRISVLEGNLIEARTTVEKTTAEREDLRLQNSRLQLQLDEVHANLSSKERVLAESQVSGERLQGELQVSERSLHKLQLEHEIAGERAEELALSVSELNQSNMALTKQLRNEQTARALLSDAVSWNTRRVEAAALSTASITAATLQGYAGETKSLQASLGQLQNMLAEKSQGGEGLQSTLLTTTAELEELRAKYEGLLREMQLLKEELGKSKKTVVIKVKEIESLTVLVKESEQTLVTHRAESEQVICAGEEAMKQMEHELNELRALAEQQEGQITEMQSTFEASVQTLGHDVTRMQAEYLSLEGRYEEERQVSKGLEKKLLECRNNHEMMIEETTATLNLLTREELRAGRQVGSEVRSSKATIEELRLQCHAEHTQVLDLTAQNSDLQKEYELVLVESRRSASQLVVAEEELNLLRSKVKTLTAEVEVESRTAQSERRAKEQLQMDLVQLRATLLQEEAARIDAEKDRSPVSTAASPQSIPPRRKRETSLSSSPGRKSLEPLDEALEASSVGSDNTDPLDQAFEQRWIQAENAAEKWAHRVDLPGIRRFSPTKRGSPPKGQSSPSRPAKIPDKVLQKYVGHSQTILCVCASESGFLFTGSQDNTARGFLIETGESKAQFRGHAAAISAVCLAEETGTLFTTSHDGTAREWDVGTGASLREFVVDAKGTGYAKGMTAVCVEDGMLYTAARDQKNPMMRWSVSTGHGEVIQSGHTSAITALCRGGGKVFSGGLKGELREWLCDAGLAGRVFEGHFQEITSLSHHEGLLYSGCRDATIKLWSLMTGRCVRTFVGHLSVVRSVCVCSEGMLSGSADGTVRLWNTETGNCIGILQNQDSAVTSLAVASGGRLFTACADGSVRLFNLKS